jgi:class 3 adenylate cyclase
LSWSDLGMNELPAGTVTVLLGGVEGSARLWESETGQMMGAVARLDGVLSEVIAAHDGVRAVEQGEGDGFVVAFARASQAVALACSVGPGPAADWPAHWGGAARW